mmetsp:Transcript_3633/g.6878  ORF Transcript_3633/g.6878 Transcript_3633/m.6878 type:complete len:319 (+) Transcript_3633:224-1180(+)
MISELVVADKIGQVLGGVFHPFLRPPREAQMNREPIVVHLQGCPAKQPSFIPTLHYPPARLWQHTVCKVPLVKHHYGRPSHFNQRLDERVELLPVDVLGLGEVYVAVSDVGPVYDMREGLVRRPGLEVQPLLEALLAFLRAVLSLLPFPPAAEFASAALDGPLDHDLLVHRDELETGAGAYLDALESSARAQLSLIVGLQVGRYFVFSVLRREVLLFAEELQPALLQDVRFDPLRASLEPVQNSLAGGLLRDEAVVYYAVQDVIRALVVAQNRAPVQGHPHLFLPNLKSQLLHPRPQIERVRQVQIPLLRFQRKHVQK